MGGASARTRSVIGLALSAGLWLPVGAIAQDGAVPEQPNASADAQPTLSSLVVALGSPDVKARIRASDHLQEGAFTLKEIEAALRAGNLSLEQRERLLGAARHRFDTEPRGAMGIQFNLAAPDTRGALVESPKNGFQAAEVLRKNDRIVHADGFPIDRQMTLRKIIVSHDPGDEVALVVERDGATIDVTVKLGDFPSLQQPMDPIVRGLAWQYRSRGYTGTASDEKPIESGLVEGAWTPGEELDDDAELLGQLPWVRARMRDAVGERLGVAAGGEARLGLGADGEAGQQGLRGPQVAVNPIQALLQQRDALNQLLKRYQTRLADANLDAAMKARLETEVRSVKQQIEGIDSAIVAMQRQPQRAFQPQLMQPQPAQPRPRQPRP